MLEKLWPVAEVMMTIEMLRVHAAADELNGPDQVLPHIRILQEKS
jgi:hypothetical protein